MAALKSARIARLDGPRGTGLRQGRLLALPEGFPRLWVDGPRKNRVHRCVFINQIRLGPSSAHIRQPARLQAS